jgi:hypothetical protein
MVRIFALIALTALLFCNSNPSTPKDSNSMWHRVTSATQELPDSLYSGETITLGLAFGDSDGDTAAAAVEGLPPAAYAISQHGDTAIVTLALNADSLTGDSAYDIRIIGSGRAAIDADTIVYSMWVVRPQCPSAVLDSALHLKVLKPCGKTHFRVGDTLVVSWLIDPTHVQNRVTVGLSPNGKRWGMVSPFAEIITLGDTAYYRGNIGTYKWKITDSLDNEIIGSSRVSAVSDSCIVKIEAPYDLDTAKFNYYSEKGPRFVISQQ